MAEPNERERRADELLSGGHPSGPRLDRVWARVEPEVVEPRGRARGLVRALLFGAVPLAATAAVVLLVVMPSSKFDPRGDSAPVIEATCGAADAPCTVDGAVHLRLLPARGVAYVFLLDGDARRRIGGPYRLDPEAAVPVTARVTPESSDAGKTIAIDVLTLDAEVTEEALAALLEKRPMKPTLELSVAP